MLGTSNVSPQDRYGLDTNFAQTDGQADKVITIYPPSFAGAIITDLCCTCFCLTFLLSDTFAGVVGGRYASILFAWRGLGWGHYNVQLQSFHQPVY